MGFLFGVIYLASGRDLWLVILTHGFVDTFGLLLIYSGVDRRLRTLVLRRRSPWCRLADSTR